MTGIQLIRNVKNYSDYFIICVIPIEKVGLCIKKILHLLFHSYNKPTIFMPGNGVLDSGT